MYFEDSLYQQGIVGVGMSSTANGYSLNDPRGLEKMPDGMKDLCRKDDIDKIMEYYGIPKQRVSVLSGKTGRYTSNKDNQQMFLAVDLLPVHIPLVEEYFNFIGNPFIPNYLYAKKQFNDARREAASEQRPAGTRKDPITGQLIDDRGNVVRTAKDNGRKNPNPYGFDEGSEDENLNGDTDEIPTIGQNGGNGEQNDIPTQSSGPSEEVGTPMSE